MGYLSAEETKSRYQRQMGPELGAAFYTVVSEVVYLHSKWADYVELFGKRPERIELLNKAAPSFFGRLQGTLFEDVLLHIARLTDKRRDTLTMGRLARMVRDDSLSARLGSLLAELGQATRFCMKWRNERIAHTNYDRALDRAASPLPPASRLAVNQALSAVRSVLSEIERHYSGSDIGFRDGMATGALDLLHVLHDGVRADEDRRARILSTKEYRPEDFEARDI